MPFSVANISEPPLLNSFQCRNKCLSSHCTSLSSEWSRHAAPRSERAGSAGVAVWRKIGLFVRLCCVWEFYLSFFFSSCHHRSLPISCSFCPVFCVLFGCVAVFVFPGSGVVWLVVRLFLFFCLRACFCFRVLSTEPVFGLCAECCLV